MADNTAGRCSNKTNIFQNFRITFQFVWALRFKGPVVELLGSFGVKGLLVLRHI
uniref:Uncharacterized protein n=1 Tax=Anguilla anguilla TaxID=7936 RepID=A0A0E9SHF8_ANGAN